MKAVYRKFMGPLAAAAIIAGCAAGNPQEDESGPAKAVVYPPGVELVKLAKDAWEALNGGLLVRDHSGLLRYLERVGKDYYDHGPVSSRYVPANSAVEMMDLNSDTWPDILVGSSAPFYIIGRSSTID